jgi:hypothetical protein
MQVKYSIPGLAGYEATRQIRHFNKVLVIIAPTVFGPVGDQERALAADLLNHAKSQLSTNFCSLFTFHCTLCFQ